MFIKIFSVPLRTVEPDYIDTGHRLVQGDVDANRLRITISDGVTPIDYDAVDHAYIIFAKKDRTVVQGVLTRDGSGYTYDMGTNEIAYPGEVLASVQLYGADGQRLTTARFKFDVLPDLSAGGAVESSTEFSSLQEAIALLEELEQRLADFPNIKVLGTYPTLEALETAWPDGSSLDGGFFVTSNGEFYIWSTVTNAWVSLGSIKGPQGDTGLTPNIQIGTVTTGTPGSSATVSRRPGSPDESPVLDFSIPRGNPGQDGTDGEDGISPTLSIGTVTTLPPGSQATVTVDPSSTPSNIIINLGLPRGYDGTGTGDMTASVYDPTGKIADAFSMGNMAEGSDAKIMTAAERTKLAGIAAGAQVNTVTSVAGKTGVVTLSADDVGGVETTAGAQAKANAAEAAAKAASAPLSHTHAATDISSGTLAVARLPSTVVQTNVAKTMTAALTAKSGTDYGTKQVRNISFKTSDFTTSDLANGEIGIVYS